MHDIILFNTDQFRREMAEIEARRRRPYVHVRIQRDQLKIGGVQTTYDVTCDRCPQWDLPLRLHTGAMEIGAMHYDAHEKGAI